MVVERRIEGQELMDSLGEVLREIHEEGTVYLVDTDEPSWGSFALVPFEIGFGVSGLIDPEYGWLTPVAVESVTTVSDLAPSHRRHPVVRMGKKQLAVGLHVPEYEQINARLDGPPPDLEGPPGDSVG